MKNDDLRIAGTVMIAIVAIAIAACEEIPQDSVKPFAGKEETQSYAGGRFDGDKALYEKTLAERAQTQDEYRVTGGPRQAE